MAYGSAAYPGGTGSVTALAGISDFVPQLWSDEIVAAYKKKLVMANLVKKISFKGKKGARINIPMPTRHVAYAKAAATAVTIEQADEGTKTLTIDKHYEYSKLIEDIADIQALSSMRKFYTDDAGYALSRQVDSSLIQLGRSTNTASAVATAIYANGYNGADGTTTYSSASDTVGALTDAAIRRTIQRLDDADAPMEDRYLVVPPSSRNSLMGLSRYTEQAFTGESGGGNTIRNGKIGDLYGIEVYVTSNADTALGSSANRVCLLFQRDAFVLGEQLAVRTQTQYKQEYLATLLTADTLYGVQILKNSPTVTDRDAATAFALVVPA